MSILQQDFAQSEMPNPRESIQKDRCPGMTEGIKEGLHSPGKYTLSTSQDPPIGRLGHRVNKLSDLDFLPFQYCFNWYACVLSCQIAIGCKAEHDLGPKWVITKFPFPLRLGTFLAKDLSEEIKNGLLVTFLIRAYDKRTFGTSN